MCALKSTPTLIFVITVFDVEKCFSNSMNSMNSMNLRDDRKIEFRMVSVQHFINGDLEHNINANGGEKGMNINFCQQFEELVFKSINQPTNQPTNQSNYSHCMNSL